MVADVMPRRGKDPSSRLGAATQKTASLPAPIPAVLSGVAANATHHPRCGGGRSGWSMAVRPCTQLVWTPVARSSVRCTRSTRVAAVGLDGWVLLNISWRGSPVKGRGRSHVPPGYGGRGPHQ